MGKRSVNITFGDLKVGDKVYVYDFNQQKVSIETIGRIGVILNSKRQYKLFVTYNDISGYHHEFKCAPKAYNTMNFSSFQWYGKRFADEICTTTIEEMDKCIENIVKSYDKTIKDIKYTQRQIKGILTTFNNEQKKIEDETKESQVQ